MWRFKPSGGSLNHTHHVANYPCWENFMATKLYQMCIIDLLISVGAIGVKLFARWSIIQCIVGLKLAKRRDVNPEFELCEETLRLCYKQMLLWSAYPLVPLLTILGVLEITFFIYVKKAIVLNTIRMTGAIVLTSKTINVVNFLFVLSLLAIFIFYGLIMVNLQPSLDCGPFRNMTCFGDPINELLDQSGVTGRYLLLLIKSVPAHIIITVIVTLVIYYYKCLANSRALTIDLLKEQVMNERHNKRLTLARIRKRKINNCEPRPSTHQAPGTLSKQQAIERVHKFANPRFEKQNSRRSLLVTVENTGTAKKGTTRVLMPRKDTIIEQIPKVAMEILMKVSNFHQLQRKTIY
eukprot:sb/3466201/